MKYDTGVFFENMSRKFRFLDFRLSPCDEYWYFGFGVLHGVKPQNQNIKFRFDYNPTK
jgi:hypothetical protein